MTTLSYVPLLADDLRSFGACASQGLLFERRFPNGATPDDAPRADGLNVKWLLQILDQEVHEAIQQPVETYEAIRQPAWEAYNAIEQPTREAYKAIQQPALEAYEAIRQPALEAYEAIRQPAREAYNAAIQPASEAYNAVIRAASLDALRALWPVWEE